MVYKNQITVFVASFLVAGLSVLLLLLHSVPTHAGNGFPCCQPAEGDSFCTDTVERCTSAPRNGTVCIIDDPTCGEPGESCTCPSGCCVFEDFECDVLTEFACDNEGGIYQGDGSNCDIAECNPPPPTIPTFSDWGKIITMAVIGLFAVIGIFAMRRRTVAS